MANLKDELNKIVDDLGKIIPKPLGDDDPVIDVNWNNVVTSIIKLTEAIGKINSVSPSIPLIGYKYFRFPGEKLPWDLYPATNRSDWIALDSKYPGVALRLSGGNASRFKYNSVYVEGIHNLYEFDTGELSGWMYNVNGWYPNYGASRYQLKDGDVVNWRYTCDLGRDVGGFSSIAGDELPKAKKKALEERIKKEKEKNENGAGNE